MTFHDILVKHSCEMAEKEKISRWDFQALRTENSS